MDTKLKIIFTNICRRHLGVNTLEARGVDRLDFHEVSVYGIYAALEAAYLAGIKDAKNECGIDWKEVNHE